MNNWHAIENSVVFGRVFVNRQRVIVSVGFYRDYNLFANKGNRHQAAHLMVKWRLVKNERGEKMLEVKQVRVALKNKLIFKDAYFTVEDHSIACLVAPNGSGKTALLNVVCGLLPSKKGFIQCNGISLRSKRRMFLNQIFFIQSTEDLFANLTVKDHLLYVKKMWHSKIDSAQVMKQLDLTDSQNKQIKQLPQDKKQYVLLAMAIVSAAPVLLMDEPLNGLDFETTQKFEEALKELREQGKSIVIASHQLDSVARISDKVLFFKDQQVLTIENIGQDMAKQYTEIYLT